MTLPARRRALHAYVLERFVVTVVGAALLALGTARMLFTGGILAVTQAILRVLTCMTFLASSGRNTLHIGAHFEMNGPCR